MGSPRTGSNPVGCEFFFMLTIHLMRNGKKTITMQNASCEDWTHDPWFTRPVLCHWAKEALFHLWPGLKQRWECCKQGENWPCICFYCFQERKWNKFTHHFNSAIFIRDLKIRSRQGSNLRSQRELDFKSNALTTRPRLLGLKCLRKAWSIKSLENERDHLFVLLKLFFEISMQTAGSLAEWSKALVLGTSPKGRGFESHRCQYSFALAFEVDKINLETPGIEPGASRMRSERSTTELHPLLGSNGISWNLVLV